jgi:hypothetical protein
VITAACTRCAAPVTGAFTITADGRGVALHCPACAADFTIAAAPSAASVPPAALLAIAPLAADAMHCPKCDTVQPAAAACRACGLGAERMAAFARADAEAALPDELHAAWARCLAAWAEPAGHERFAELTARSGAYAWAARQYRAAGRTRAGDPIVASQLTRLARMTEATLRASAAPRPTGAPAKPYRATLAVLVLVVVIAGAGVVWAMLPRDHDDGAPVITPAVSPVHH